MSMDSTLGPWEPTRNDFGPDHPQFIAAKEARQDNLMVHKQEMLQQRFAEMQKQYNKNILTFNENAPPYREPTEEAFRDHRGAEQHSTFYDEGDRETWRAIDEVPWKNIMNNFWHGHQIPETGWHPQADDRPMELDIDRPNKLPTQPFNIRA